MNRLLSSVNSVNLEAKCLPMVCGVSSSELAMVTAQSIDVIMDEIEEIRVELVQDRNTDCYTTH